MMLAHALALVGCVSDMRYYVQIFVDMLRVMHLEQCACTCAAS